MKHGKVGGAVLAQILGQALAGWTLVTHAAGWPDVSIWVVVFTVAAIAVPFRHNGSWRDRAAGNFGAAMLLSGFLWWDVLEGGLDSIIGGGGFGLGVETLLSVTASVLFSVAGALFWILGREESA